MNEFESAKGDFEKVLEVNPQNKAARLQISMCQKKAKEHNERDRRIYANMFKKFAEQDAKVRAEPTHLQVAGGRTDRTSDFHPKEVPIGHRPRKTTREATRREEDFRADQGCLDLEDEPGGYAVQFTRGTVVRPWHVHAREEGN